METIGTDIADEELRLALMAGTVAGCPRVLDVGWASLPNPFLENDYVAGLDLEELEELPPNYSDQFFGDAYDLPKPFAHDTFDAVLAGEIIHCLENPSKFLRGCYELLMEEGVLVLSTPNPSSPRELLMSFRLSREGFDAGEYISLIPQRWLMKMMEDSGFSDVEIISHTSMPRAIAETTIAIGRKLAE